MKLSLWQRNVVSELDEQASVDASACEVVGDSIAVVFRVGNPVIGVHVVDAEQVEGIYTKPYVAEMLLPPRSDAAFLIVQEAVAHADVDTAIGGCSEQLLLAS